MVETVVFEVQGSENERYIVRFRRDGDNLTATCTCRAASCGLHCKHRVNLVLGDVTAVVAGNEHISRLPDIVKGSDVEREVIELIAAEGGLDAAIRRRKAAVAALAAAFRD